MNCLFNLFCCKKNWWGFWLVKCLKLWLKCVWLKYLVVKLMLVSVENGWCCIRWMVFCNWVILVSVLGFVLVIFRNFFWKCCGLILYEWMMFLILLIFLFCEMILFICIINGLGLEYLVNCFRRNVLMMWIVEEILGVLFICFFSFWLFLLKRFSKFICCVWNFFGDSEIKGKSLYGWNWMVIILVLVEGIKFKYWWSCLYKKFLVCVCFIFWFFCKNWLFKWKIIFICLFGSICLILGVYCLIGMWFFKV